MLKFLKVNKSVILLITIMIMIILLTIYISGIYESRLTNH